MDTRHLEFFVAVAEELNFTRAAERVSAVQSTVSAGVQALEREIGASLFTRSTRRVSLTATGRDLLPRAREALTALAQMRAIGSQAHEQMTGRLRIGITTPMEPAHLPVVLGEFHRVFPLVEITLHTSSNGSSGLAEHVRRGSTDVAFCGLAPSKRSGLYSEVLIRQQLMAVLPAGHPLAARRRVPISRLLGEDWVDTPEGLGARQVVDDWLARGGLSRRVTAEVPDPATIPDFVAAGLGVAVAPADIAGRDPRASAGNVEDAISVLPLTEALSWEVCVIAREHGRAPAVEALLQHLSLSLPIT